MSTIQETEVLREWRDSAHFWEKHAQTIRLMFAPVTRALIEDAHIRQGYKVLDVAGGPGEPSLTIAELVGPSGMVTCTDAIPAMVAAAENEGKRRGLTNVEFRHCTADSLPFDDDQFDAAVSRLGVMFFPDPIAGLREMLRVTKRGGVVSLVVWDKSDLNPFSYIVTNVMARYFKTSAATLGASDAFKFAEPGTLAAALRGAGADSVKERVLRFHIEAPISLAGFWALRSETSGTLREKLNMLSDEEKEQAAQEVQEAAREFFPNNEMRFPTQMIIVTGNKPN
ncbi:MAG TPA: class I SAM-dependent methyltransferase [Pyrinomonadaceae bacterium]|nr:class I SAM-dependent methyltransferase [Pyrinomonadaceae bacterium]